MRSTGNRKVRLVALTGALVMMASACNWMSYGSDYANSRTAKGETIIRSDNVSTLHELWRVDGTVGSTSTPAVFGDTVYFGSWDGKLRAVSAADGSPPRPSTRRSGRVVALSEPRSRSATRSW